MGIGAQSGTIKVVIDVRGQGDGAAVVDKASKALKSLWTDEEIAKNKALNASVVGIGKGLAEGLKPVTEMGGGLAAVRMGMMGIPGAVAGMGAAVIGFAATLNDAFATDLVKEFHDEFTRDIAGLERSVASLTAKLAEAGKTVRSLSGDELEVFGKLRDKEQQAEGALAQARAHYEALPGFAQAMAEFTGVQREQEEKIHKIKVDQLHAATLAKEVEFSALGISAQQLTNRILQVDAARRLNEQIDGMVRKSWALLAPLKAAGGALGVVGALGAGGVVNDAMNRELMKPRGGGGGTRPKDQTGDDFRDVTTELSDRASRFIGSAKEGIASEESGRQAAIKRRDARDLKAFRAANDNAADEEGIAAEAADARAQGIRDISSAIMESIPALDQYAASLGQITDVWAEYAKTSVGMGAAVATTIGNLAKVGAQQIKDERARAGVLAAINFGLFLASEFVPGMQAQAGGYLAGSIALGVVAATGIGTGGGASGGGAGAARNTPRTSLIRESSGRQSNGPIVLNIGVLAGGSPQENAESIGRILDRRRAA